jgi:hypothetical protein
MRWFIICFLRSPEKAAYISLLTGFAIGGISCAASESICNETIKGAEPIAVSINLIALIYVFTKRDIKTINRTELLRQYSGGDITTKNMLKKYGGLMAGLCILLFWAGWFGLGVLINFLATLFGVK